MSAPGIPRLNENVDPPFRKLWEENAEGTNLILDSKSLRMKWRFLTEVLRNGYDEGQGIMDNIKAYPLIGQNEEPEMGTSGITSGMHLHCGSWSNEK